MIFLWDPALDGRMHILVFAFLGLLMAAFSLSLVVMIAIFAVYNLKKLEHADHKQ